MKEDLNAFAATHCSLPGACIYTRAFDNTEPHSGNFHFLRNQCSTRLIHDYKIMHTERYPDFYGSCNKTVTEKTTVKADALLSALKTNARGMPNITI